MDDDLLLSPVLLGPLLPKLWLEVQGWQRAWATALGVFFLALSPLRRGQRVAVLYSLRRLTWRFVLAGGPVAGGRGRMPLLILFFVGRRVHGPADRD